MELALTAPSRVAKMKAPLVERGFHGTQIEPGDLAVAVALLATMLSALATMLPALIALAALLATMLAALSGILGLLARLLPATTLLLTRLLLTTLLVLVRILIHHILPWAPPHETTLRSHKCSGLICAAICDDSHLHTISARRNYHHSCV